MSTPSKKYAFCTSFSPEGFELYGRTFIETYCKNNVHDIPLYVFYEIELPNVQETYGKPVIFVNLWEDAEMKRFIGRHGEKHWAQGRVSGTEKVNYRFQALKFAKKVYAYTNAPQKVDWWIWLDADVQIDKPFDDAFFEATCPDDALLTYVGRDFWSHSECGFMAFNMRNGAESFLLKMREIYTSGMLFGLPEWHDSYVFDCVRRMFVLGLCDGRTDPFISLTGDAEDEDETVSHPWPRTILGDYMRHHKGPERKIKEYGATL